MESKTIQGKARFPSDDILKYCEVSEMISLRCQSVARHTVLLCTALVLSLGYASAQQRSAPDSSASATISSTESSSNALQLDDASVPDLAALPAAPKPDGARGGQYDNR